MIEPITLTVIGNKIDLEKQRAVSREEAFLYASSINGTYYETSAINGGRGIEQVFLATARGLLRLSEKSDCSSIKRYESNESLVNFHDLNGKQQTHLAIKIEQTEMHLAFYLFKQANMTERV